MSAEIKPVVTMEETFDRLDFRVGRIISVEQAENAAKPSYMLKADFGRFGIRTSVARLTQHPVEEINGKQIFGVLNFPPRTVGGIVSEFLCLGVQIPRPTAARRLLSLRSSKRRWEASFSDSRECSQPF